MTRHDTAATDAADAGAIVREFEGAKLGDRRRTVRLTKLADALAKAPGASLPDALPTRADEDAAYRFLSNEAVTAEAILAPHLAQTARRAAQARLVLVAHDSTELAYGGTTPRAGLGRLGGRRRQGFFAHVSLALTADALREPLGLLGLSTWARTDPRRSSQKKGRRRNGTDYARSTKKESQRWGQHVQRTEEQVGPDVQLLHVMDREADAFPLLSSLVTTGRRFVIRLTHDRLARDAREQTRGKVRALVAQADDVFTLDVPVSARAAKPAPRANETSGARAARTARVGVRARAMELRRPRYLSDGPEWLPVHLVEVYEVDPPPDVEPVRWVLVTTEPLETAADVQAIVSYYRARWVIEEFFKALKTGCAVERRQLESYDALVNLLAIFAPIAWQMLRLRTLARSTPEAPAETALTPTQLDVLRACSPKPLPTRLTVRRALFAVASLGGHHLPRDPGWLVLARGMEKLLLLEAGWMAHQMALERCDGT